MTETLREQLWKKWHVRENKPSVLARLEQINRYERNRLSACDRVLEKGDLEQDRKMLKHWSQKIDDCAYELLGIANGLLGRKMP